MNTPTNDANQVDTGQTDNATIKNINNKPKNVVISQFFEKKKEKQKKKTQVSMLVDDLEEIEVNDQNIDVEDNTNNNGESDEDEVNYEENNNEDESEKKDKFFTLETEFERTEGAGDDEYAMGLIEMSIKLLQDWTNNQVIDDVCDKENNLIDQEYEIFDKSMIQPRAVKRKDYVKVDAIIHIKTQLKACGLHMNQKEYCDHNDLRISGKNTGVEHTKKIGFLSGAHVKLASQEKYSNEIIEEMELDQNLINIKKEHTCEKGNRSKVLSVYAVEREAKEIDEASCELKSPRYACMSYRHATSDERLAAMHRNDRCNIKSRYETLFNVNLKEDVWDEKKNKYVKLEEFLVEVKKDENPLFLAIEKGTGKHDKDANAVINPQTRAQ